MNLTKVLCAGLMCMTVFAPFETNAGTNDDIANACYLTSHCGSKAFARTLVASTAAGAGALAGFASPLPGGFIMGGYAGYVVGNKLGGTFLAGDANEYIRVGNKCLECDTYQIGEHYECPNGTIVTNGSKVMKCHTTASGDYWSDFTLPACHNSPIQSKTAKGTKAEIKATVNKVVGTGVIVTSGDACLYITCGNGGTYDKSKNECVKPSTTQKCPNGKKTGETWTAACSGSSWESVKLYGKDCGARCNSGGDYSIYAITCKNGYTPSDKWDAIAGGGYKACVKKGNGGGNGGGGGGTTPVSCRDSRTTATGKACCDTGRMATYNAATDTCTCSARGLTFKIENGIGKCVPISTTPTTYDCEKDNAAEMSNVRAWKAKCASNTEIMTQISSLEEFCKAAGRTKDAFMDYYNALVAMNPGQCGAVAPGPSEEEKFCAQISDAQMVGGVCKCKDTTKELDREQKKCVASQASMNASKTTIETTFKKLDGINSTFGTSVWKNKEGNFNTARLASDATAGVVLGTVGGLVTSNVVKKNQIKGGFEDINCTIGGQVVSGWGDEFNVGINTSGQ